MTVDLPKSNNNFVLLFLLTNLYYCKWLKLSIQFRVVKNFVNIKFKLNNIIVDEVNCNIKYIRLS